MPALSAIIITKNEEEYIARCLDSLHDVADEIIVMDSFSDDRTKEICKSYSGVRFYEHAFDTFSAQKNRANQLAENTYLLSLDADEYLSPELKDDILRIKLSADHIAYRFPRLNFIGQKALKHGIWFPDRKIRLFKKEMGHWIGDGIHEVMHIKGDDILDLNSFLMHTVFNNTNEIAAKFERYSTLWANEKSQLNKTASCLSPFAHAAWTAFRG